MLRTCSLNWVKLEAAVMPKGFIKVLKNNQQSLPSLSPVRLHKDLADVLFEHKHHTLSNAVIKINQIWETLWNTGLPHTGSWRKHQYRQYSVPKEIPALQSSAYIYSCSWWVFVTYMKIWIKQHSLQMVLCHYYTLSSFSPRWANEESTPTPSS